LYFAVYDGYLTFQKRLKELTSRGFIEENGNKYQTTEDGRQFVTALREVLRLEGRAERQ